MTYWLILVCLILLLLAFLAYLPVPFLTRKEEKSVKIGKVTKIKKIRCGLIAEIQLTTEKNRSQTTALCGPVVIHITENIYLRNWQLSCPKIGEIIKVKTLGRYYLLQDISLDWITSWEHYRSKMPTETIGSLLLNQKRHYL